MIHERILARLGPGSGLPAVLTTLPRAILASGILPRAILAGTSLALAGLAIPSPSLAQLPRAEQTRPDNVVLTHRQEDPLIRERLRDRFDNLLPELMRREGFDMWLVITREYNSDPVFRSMAPITTYSSRRRTILMFHDLGPGRGVERISVGRADYQGTFDVYRTHNDSQ